MSYFRIKYVLSELCLILYFPIVELDVTLLWCSFAKEFRYPQKLIELSNIGFALLAKKYVWYMGNCDGMSVKQTKPLILYNNFTKYPVPLLTRLLSAISAPTQAQTVLCLSARVADIILEENDNNNITKENTKRG